MSAWRNLWCKNSRRAWGTSGNKCAVLMLMVSVYFLGCESRGKDVQSVGNNSNKSGHAIGDGGNVVLGVPIKIADEAKWKRFFDTCIGAVAESTNKFFQKGMQIPAKELAKRMRWKLDAATEVLGYGDPYGSEVSTLLEAMTTANGLTREGLFGKKSAYEVEVNGKRVRLYDWLKAQLGVGKLPGEFTFDEEQRTAAGGRVNCLPLEFGTNRFVLLVKLDQMLRRCGEVIQSTDCTFYDGDTEVNKEKLVALLNNHVNSPEIRRRLLLQDLEGLGIGGGKRVTIVFKKLLEEAFEVCQSRITRDAMATDFVQRHERVADALRSNRVKEAFELQRALLESRREVPRFYTVKCDNIQKTILEWIFETMKLEMPPNETMEMPESVKRLFDLLAP